MGRKLLKTVQTITTFRNPLADPLWSADPSLKTAELDNMQTTCTSIHTDNDTNTSSLNFYKPDALPDAQQQCQSTEGTL